MSQIAYHWSAVDFFDRDLHTRTAVTCLTLHQLSFLVCFVACVFSFLWLLDVTVVSLPTDSRLVIRRLSTLTYNTVHRGSSVKCIPTRWQSPTMNLRTSQTFGVLFILLLSSILSHKWCFVTLLWNMMSVTNSDHVNSLQKRACWLWWSR